MAVSTLSYIALGVTVAGMVTKNKTLLKIGGQLGMAAGVAGIGQALMGAAASTAAGAAGQAGGAAATGAGEAAAGAAADAAAQAAPLASAAAPAADITATGLNIPGGAASSVPAITPPVADTYSGILGGGGGAAAAPAATEIGSAAGTAQGVLKTLGTEQGAIAGAEAGTKQGTEAGTTQGGAAQGDKKEGSFGKFFDFLKDDKGKYDKYIVTEGAKLIGGGIQGAYGTHVANKKLEEEQRIAAVKLANAKSASGFGNRTVVRG
jgi:hypothetical protein